MKFQNFAKLIPIFILGVLLIAVYRTFDNFGVLWGWGGRLLSILVPFIIGGIIAYLLLPPCRFFEKLYSKSKVKFVNKGRRPLAVVTVFAITLAAIGILLRIVIPAIAQSVQEFIDQWPELYANFQTFIINLEIFDAYEVEQFFSDENIMELVTGFINMDNVMVGMQGIIGFSMAVFNLFIGFVVSIYILIDRRSLYKLIHKIAHLYIKPKFLKPLVKYTRKINEFLYRYIYSQFLDSIIMGVLSFIGLSIISAFVPVTHIPVSALLLGIFNFIPYFGSIAATVIAILLALLSDGFHSAVVVTVFLLILQQTDANFIQPRLAGAYLKVRPLWIILGILVAGGMGGGIWGMFIAPPIVAMIKIIVNDIIEHREKRLGIKIKPKNEEQDKEHSEEKPDE